MIIKLFTHLKNTDLEAVSAYQTITELLHFSALTGLSRKRLWELTVEETKETKFQVQKVLSESYYLSNPNKEKVYQDQPPPVVCGANEVVFLVLVSPTQKESYENLRESLKNRFGLVCSKIQKSVLWELTISKEAAITEEMLLRQVVLCSEKGILVNPLYEDYRLTRA